MRRYYVKNFIAIAFVVMLSFLILGASFVAMGRNYALRERRSAIEDNVTELSRLASAYASMGSISDLDFRVVLSTIARSTGNHCFATDIQGLIVSCSDTDFDCGHIGRRVGDAVMNQLWQSGSYSDLSRLDGMYEQSRYVAALPVVAGGFIVGYVFVGTDASVIVQTWSHLMNLFFVTAIIIMCLTLVFGFITLKWRSKPINEMAAAALKFAHGDFSVRVSGGERSDEIGALASSFNRMAEALEQTETRRSDFIANVAHELKTPMTTISGFADGILDGTIPPELQDRYLETISSETKRLNRLVRSMLDISRMQGAGAEELRRRSFDAGELLARTLVVFESKINDKRLEVNAMIPEDAVIVLGDVDAINQVIYNLLENAVKFAEPGTELGVSLFRQGEKAYISVKNHGETIAPEELSVIFERFHKADRSRSMDRDGYGLGLYIVKTILNNHGEDITVTSREGVTEFVFSLSLKPAVKQK